MAASSHEIALPPIHPLVAHFRQYRKTQMRLMMWLPSKIVRRVVEHMSKYELAGIDRAHAHDDNADDDSNDDPHGKSAVIRSTNKKWRAEKRQQVRNPRIT